MTGLPNLNRKAFKDMSRKLCELGFMVVNPHDLFPDGNPPTYEEAMRVDLLLLLRCDAVLLLPGWEASKGANIEVDVASVTGIPVYQNTQTMLLHFNISTARRRRPKPAIS